MNYTLTGGAGNISKPLALQLLKAGHNVTVIGRNPDHLKELIAAGAKAAIGSVEDITFLANAFSGADAVYTMVPPHFAATDWKAYIGGIGANYAEAIKVAGVSHVVNLSSMGAHLPEGCGPVSGLYRAEQAFNLLNGVHVLHLRPSYFFPNLLANIGMIKGLGIIGGNFRIPEGKFPIVATDDIAAVAASALLELKFSGHTVQYIVSDEVSTDRIAAVLGAAIGKPGLAWITFTDEQALNGMIQAGLPGEIASNYAEMNQAMNSGAMFEHYFASHTPVAGKIKLTDFAKDFAAAYLA